MPPFGRGYWPRSHEDVKLCGKLNSALKATMFDPHCRTDPRSHRCIGIPSRCGRAGTARHCHFRVIECGHEIVRPLRLGDCVVVEKYQGSHRPASRTPMLRDIDRFRSGQVPNSIASPYPHITHGCRRVWDPGCTTTSKVGIPKVPKTVQAGLERPCAPSVQTITRQRGDGCPLLVRQSAGRRALISELLAAPVLPIACDQARMSTKPRR